MVGCIRQIMLPYLPYGARKPEDNNKNVPTPTVIIAHAMPQTSEHTLIGIWLAARRLEVQERGSTALCAPT